MLLLFFHLNSDSKYESLLEGVLRASRADNTVKKYSRSFAAWQVWSNNRGVLTYAPGKEQIARYLIDLYKDKAPFSRIEGALYGIKWHLDSNHV